MTVFAEKLKKLMDERHWTQADIRKLTGIGASAISQYINGKNEPYPARKREIALALGVDENYFSETAPAAATEIKLVKAPAANVRVETVAKLMHKSKEWVKQGLRDQVFPWGYAVKLKNWSYFISPARFTQETGIEIPPQIGIEG